MTLRAKPECPQGTILGARFALEILVDSKPGSTIYNAHVIDPRIQSKQNTHFFVNPVKTKAGLKHMRASHGANVHVTVHVFSGIRQLSSKNNTAHSEMLITSHYMLSIYSDSPSAWSVEGHSPLAAPRMVLASTFSAWHGTWNRQESFKNWLGETLPTWCVSRVLSKNLKLTCFFLRTFWDLSCPESFVLSSDSENDQHEMLPAAQSAWNSANVLLKGLMSFFSLRSLSQRATNAVFLAFLFFSWALSQISLEKETWSIVKHREASWSIIFPGLHM